MKNIPERIYLQIGAKTPKDCNFEELDEITWCQDRISENDIEYIRKEKAIEAFKAVMEDLSYMQKSNQLTKESKILFSSFTDELNK